MFVRKGDDRLSINEHSGKCWRVEFGYYRDHQQGAMREMEKRFASALTDEVSKTSIFRLMTLR